MIFKDEISTQLDFLMRKEKEFKSRLKKMPRGRLKIKKAKGRYYFYEVKQGEMKSLLGNPELKQEYLEKRDIEKELGKIKRDIVLLNRMAEEYEPVMADGTIWPAMSAQQNGHFTENLKHQYRDVYYRSKSELAIAMMLASYGLEFKYEVEAKAGWQRFYPDFAIKRPTDGKVFLWEHFGLVGDDEYRTNMFEKLQAYYEDGYRLWDNLIISFDREDGSANGDYIEKIVKLYLL